MIARPWSVQVELAEGCTRLCSFCGLNAIRNGPGAFKFMTVANAQTIATRLSRFVPRARIEFAMHGEPLANPRHAEILSAFRAALPDAQIQVTTNGGPLRGKMAVKLDAIFSSGANFVVIDTYRPERDALLKEIARLPAHLRVVDFYREWAPRKLSPYMRHHPPLQRTVVVLDDLEARSGEVASRTIKNQGGNSPARAPLKEPRKLTCTNPFREMVVLWSGAVQICCDDWSKEYPCGNLIDEDAETIWEGSRFEAARAMLQARERGFGPCAACDQGAGARSGLLPKYSAPTDQQRALALSNTRAREGAEMSQ